MKIEKKLIACSILALAIGISSVLPLTFLMSATAQAETAPEPWFSINIPYAYWITKDGTIDYSNSSSFQDDPFEGGFELNETNCVSERHMALLNLTLNVDTANEPVDGRVEYYQIDLSSDKELVETTYFFIGTNSNSSFTFDDVLDKIHFMRDDWFDTDQFNSKFGGGGGLLAYNWTAGFSRLSSDGGSGEGTLGSSGTSRRVTALREAETLSITVYRLGWATFSGNSTTFTSANNEIVDQIQFEKFSEEEWLYNDLIPEDELADTNLLQPLSYEEMY
jgi:hypothetical protein